MRPLLSRLVASVLASSFVNPFLTGALAVLMPRLAGELGVQPHEAPLSLAVLAASTAALALPFGRLADLRGHPSVYRGGLAVAAVASAAAAAAPGWTALLASMALLGAGMAMVFGSNNAMLAASAPPGRAAALIGMNSTAVYVGLAVGPLAGGLLGLWRPLFLLAATVLTASLWLAPDGPRAGRGGRPDLAGSALLAGAVACGVAGLAAGNVPLGLLGLVLGVAALRVEASAADPVLDVRLFSNRAFASAAAAALLSYTATAALAPVLALKLEGLGYGEAQVGALVALQAVPMAACAPLVGRLVSRGAVRPEAVAAAGSCLVAASVAAVAAFGGVLLPLWLALVGLGFALFIVPNTDILLSSVEPDRRGTASAVVAEARLVGQSLSNALASLLLARSPDAALGALALLSVAAAVVSLARPASSGAGRGQGRR